MQRWLLDTSALPTLRDDEAGAQQVADLLAAALAQQAECHACFMTLMELTCRVWMDQGEPAARLAHGQCLSLPLRWVHASPPLLWQAVQLKALHRMSIADAWIAAAARLAGATLVHKDPGLGSWGQVLPFASKTQDLTPAAPQDLTPAAKLPLRRESCSPLTNRALERSWGQVLLRVVGYLPGARIRASIRHDLRAGVAQASREETAATATGGRSRHRSYGDLSAVLPAARAD